MSDLSGSAIALEVRRIAACKKHVATADVADLTEDEFLELLEAAGEMDRLHGSIMSKLAGETARRSSPELPGGGLARTQGHGNPGKMMENITGGSGVGARRQVEAGEAFDLVPDEAAPPQDASAGDSSVAPPPAVTRHKWPHVAATSMAGELSVEAAAIIVKGLNELKERVSGDTLDEIELRLVNKARAQTVSDVRRTVTATVARFDPQGVEDRQRQQHQERYLSWKQDHQGVVKIHGVLDPVTAAPVLNVLEQMVTASYRRRRQQDPADQDTRTVGQMRADALFDLCRHIQGCSDKERSGVRTTLVVRMDLDDLMGSGAGLGQIDGIDTPVAASELRRLAGDLQVIPEVLASDGRVLDLGTEQRGFQWWQRIALVERDGGCAKCHAPPEHCEAHHIKYWRFGGETNLDNGVMLCTRCHTDVHNQGWDIEINGREVSFIPPTAIDPEREPQPGALAAFDIGDIPNPSAYPDDWEITPELEAEVRRWERESPQQEYGWEEASIT